MLRLNHNHSKRWYDQDPTVSLAVSILRNTSQVNQLHVAEILINNGKNLNIHIKKKITLFSRRWYDYDERMSDAIEYFRFFPPEEQKKIAMEIIEYLYSLDCSSCK